MMIAKLENQVINVYDEQNARIGSFEHQAHFKAAKIQLGHRVLKIEHSKRNIQITEDEQVIFRLKSDALWGNTEISETKQKIKGLVGFKWGIQMLDAEQTPLLRIKNENQWFNNNHYIIEVLNSKASNWDILITLYLYLYSSKMKLTTVVLAVLIAVISVSVHLSSN